MFTLVIKFIPGTLAMMDNKTQFLNVREKFQLWQKKTENPDEIYDMEAHLDFSPYKNLIYTADAKGAEIVYSTTDIDLFIDKPLQADGKVLSPQLTKAMYIKGASAQNSAIHIMGNLPESTQIIQKHQFVIENAFLTTGPLETLYLTGKYNEKNDIVDGQLSLKFDLLRLVHPSSSSRWKILSKFID